MEVSVVIPTYNRNNELRRAVDSVRNQTLPPLEIIIVDDGSDDALGQLNDGEYQNVKIIHQSNKGVSAARNKGIDESQGKWITFLDSDDWWLPTKLEKQIHFHRQFPEYLISQTDEVWIRNNIQVNPKKYHQKKAGWIYQSCLERCMITPSAAMISREVFEDVGVFDENLPACEDYDLWLRITSKYPVGLIEEKLVVKTGGHSDQLSRKYWGMDRFRVEALEKLMKCPIDPEMRRSTLHMLVTKSRILALGSLKRGNQDFGQIYQLKAEQYQAELERMNEA